MSMISLKNITKCYGSGEGETLALNDINLEIEEGEMIAIMGPSGSGKSTLLNILGLIDIPTKGEYFINSKRVSELKSNDLAKLRNEKVGFIFQNFNLLYDYNLIYNVSIPITYSKNKKGMKERAESILKEVGLEDHKTKTPDKLSGGQKQRVAIARALVNNPDIILADEPTGALDKETGENILDMLEEINKKGKTVIVITHDVNIAKRCKKIINIVDGKLL